LLVNQKRLYQLALAGGVALAMLLVLTGSIAWRVLFAPPTPAAIDARDPLEEARPARDSAPGPVQAEAAPSDATLVEAIGRAPITYNPLYATDPAAQSIIAKLYPRLVGQAPQNGTITPTELAHRWEISPDGRTYTFFLRTDARWSDGTPVTAADVKFTYDALASPLVRSPYRDRTLGIAQIDAPDATTLVVRLTGPNCAILHSLRQPILPSHVYAADFNDLATHPQNQAPTLGAGPFLWQTADAARIVLVRNPDDWRGPAQIGRWELRILPDPAARWQALAAGQVDLVQFTPAESAALTDLGAESLPNVNVYLAQSDGYSFLALNQADPANPQPGRGPDGALLPQPPHPILGDPAVRRALASAIDYAQILTEVFQGRATQPAAYVPAASWASAPDLAPPRYDPARANLLLDEAGWLDEDGDGVRSRNGQPLRLNLQTNADNPQRVQMVELIAAQLGRVGVQAVAAALPFEELTTTLLEQRFDLVVIGWENLGADPGNSPFWHSQADLPGTGYNFTSVQDGEIDGLLDAAAQFPGCDPTTRAELYQQVQQRIADLHPYLLLAAPQALWAYADRWQGIAPGPWSLDHNVTTWHLPTAWQ
jgi:peptide/nickel transport system substrate-binding protein